MGQERVDNLFASESWSAVYTAYTNISLKSYDFDTIREALLAYVKTTYPDKFNDFIASSEFIAILDLVAYLGHSLAFRLDMNTRENFLDTAERKESVLRMAKNLGYLKTRPINARGFMKITSVTTSQNVFDNAGDSLANTTIGWNDANDTDWYEKFIIVLDSALAKNSKILDPIATVDVLGIENNIYEVNENTTGKAISYPFTSDVAGSTRLFETIKVSVNNDAIIENEPNIANNFTIVNRNDNLGPASDRTGFFVYSKAGELKFQDFTYNVKLSNIIKNITNINISNSDVWLQKIDNNGRYFSTVNIVDNESKETAIYNSLKNGTGDLASITTNVDNSIKINFPDGVFGNAAYGNYRVWYRQVENQNFTVNANDIDNVSITVPYIGEDDRPYNLTLTMSTTRDFSENYAAETFESVRQIAPRAYYSQDRMVNAQDYNIYPLTLGSNVITKSKAVNTTFAGNSRFFEMDDVTGHHSNVSAIGTDGSIFLEDDNVTMGLSFNRENNQVDNFIRNKITEVIKHPSLMNLYYCANMHNPNSVITDPDLNFTTRSTQRSIIDVSSSVPYNTVYIYPGDHILVNSGNENTMTWTNVANIESSVAGAAMDSYFIDYLLPEDTGTIDRIVRGYRTRLEDSEINNIKINKIEDLSVQNFTIMFESGTNTNVWGWRLHDELIDPPLVAGTDVFIKFTYVPGIRENEASYTAKFTGKKIVFDSTKQIKFHYNNTKSVVNNETKLAERDSLFLKYYTTINNTAEENSENQTIHIGTGDLKDIIIENDAATFNVGWGNTPGSVITNTFVDTSDCLEVVENVHTLVSPGGETYDITPDSSTTIGISPTYTVAYTVDNLSSKLSTESFDGNIDIDTIDPNSAIVSAGASVVSFGVASISNSAASNTASTVYSSTYTDSQLVSNGFKGEVSDTYFDIAAANGNFAWIDESEVIATGKTRYNATNSDFGVQTEFFTQFDGSNTYQFTFDDLSSTGFAIQNDTNDGSDPDSPDLDIYWKQYAFAEINFTAPDVAPDNFTLKDSTGTDIDLKHCEIILTAPDTYKILFWTVDPNGGENNQITVSNVGGTANLSDFKVQLTRNVRCIQIARNSSYTDVETYIVDKYITPAGYVDYSKVKLSSSDITRNPHGMLEVFSNEDVYNNANNLGDVSILNFSHIVLETYTDEKNIEYERVSNRVVAYNETQIDSIPETAVIRFFISKSDILLSDGIWQEKTSSGWEQLSTDRYELVDPDKNDSIIYNGVNYRIVLGRSYVEDKFMTFRWDHYADIDKRIDPSTSNIIDLYILSTDYVRRVNTWINSGFSNIIPAEPTNYELTKVMQSIETKASISDHISYIPVKFKYLFGSFAAAENQAVFKVVKKAGTAYSESEIKSAVANAVNTFFDIDNWDFGETFYFSELASYVHRTLPDYISSIIVTPKYQTGEFSNLLSISSEPTEIFLSLTSSADVKIISSIVAAELLGE
jgi:hypothetical protein